jgi:Na+-transporting NADH:ubiquinone oxidoreductase subunit NqrB
MLYRSLAHLQRDPRHYQIAFLGTFLCYGIIMLGWQANLPTYALIAAVSVAVQLLGAWAMGKPFSSLKSALITTLSLCILFKANNSLTYALAAALAIGSKFILHDKGKHFFNPANFGIIACIILTGDAWISPGQWGNGAIMLFLVGSLGMWILFKVRRFDTCIAFFITFAALQYYRQVLYLGWTNDVFFQQITSGSLLLFSFFMITDPVSTPNAPKARIVWAVSIAIIAYYISTYYYVNAAPIWTLFFMSPLTPLFDRLLPNERFEWLPTYKIS